MFQSLGGEAIAAGVFNESIHPREEHAEGSKAMADMSELLNGGGGLASKGGEGPAAVPALEGGLDGSVLLGSAALAGASRSARRGCRRACDGAMLQEQGYEVSVLAKDFPPHTTSKLAGAVWRPGSTLLKARPEER